MGYATLFHVQARCPQRTFSATSVPTATQVLQYLDDVGSELDSLLQAAGYQLPVPGTATVALGLLRRANTVGAWYMTEAAAPVSQDVERAEKEWQRLQSQLDPHGKGTTLELPGVPRQTDETLARGGTILDAATGDVATSMFSLDPLAW